MPKKLSVAGAVRAAVRDDAKTRAAYTQVREGNPEKTKDSFQNFAAKLGIGADNQLSSSTYGFNPVSRYRTILEWMHRGSWLGGVAVDIIADDMTKMGVDLKGDLEPDYIQQLERAAVTWNIWGELNDTIKWARLYGGAIAVMMIDGQDPATPLNIDRVGKGAFRGLLVLDRWMIEPSLNDLVSEPGPDLGLPKYYSVVADAPAIPRMRIHYSRCLRFEGIRLPYWQRLTENLWGISVIERLYDRMVAFDSASTGAAKLIYKAWLRTYGVKGLREIVAAGGDGMAALLRQVQFMRQTQSMDGITLMDSEDTFQIMQHSAFGGLSECIIQFGQQISGSLQIPLVRLFGQSPVGMNATGESDLRTYYDGIRMRQEREMRVPVTRVYRVMAAGEGLKLPEGFGVEFRPLWIMNDSEKYAAAGTVASTVGSMFESGVISRETALKELKQSSKVTGVFSNISDEELAAAKEEPAPAAQTLIDDQREQEQLEQQAAGGGAPGKTKDRILNTGDVTVSGFPVVIEQQRGEERYGRRLPAAYGMIRRTGSAEGAEEQMDCFVGGDANSGKIFIVDSYDENGNFDEHKVMFGYGAESAALRDFSLYYYERRPFIAEVTAPHLREWLAAGDVTKPFTQPTDVQYTVAAHNAKEVCGNCSYFQGMYCINQNTARDPRVPVIMGQKIVTPASWCKKFEKKKETVNV